ncbi:MAG TPA: ferredoxin [Prosthecobacter sp.]
MADLTDRIPQNVPGRFYLDSTCTDCDLCREMAPAFFRRDDDIGQTYVFHQPVTEEEIQQATEALEGCPTNSIGDEAA